MNLTLIICFSSMAITSICMMFKLKRDQDIKKLELLRDIEKQRYEFSINHPEIVKERLDYLNLLYNREVNGTRLHTILEEIKKYT